MATARGRPAEILGHMRRWARFSLWAVSAICGIRYRVTGLDRLPKGAVILASRHQSAFDTIVWFHLVPNTSYVLKDQLTKLPFAGPLLVPAGMIAVDRDGGAKTMRGLIKDGRQAVRDGRQIVIFPEGTRAPPDQLLPLQPGVAALATGVGPVDGTPDLGVIAAGVALGYLAFRLPEVDFLAVQLGAPRIDA